ncbi:MAG: DUF1295 domain-containing protein [Phycisphaeraceae bacterium]|nr:DUF1295 domain-containing protein [Phycisphaeraceae bacterium]
MIGIGSAIVIAWLVLSVTMLLLWMRQRRTGNAGTVDVAWALGTGLAGAWFALAGTGLTERRWVVGLMAGTWSVRLGLHLARRVRTEREDGRYAALRETWGSRTQRNLFLFFQLQATWAILFALPMLAAAMNPAPLGMTDLAALLVCAGAVVGEAVADRQLAAFRSDPANRGRVCSAGLWGWSRHPNYFFEWTHWFSYVLLASRGPAWWLAPVGPILMYLFLTRITGIPPTEARALRSRGDAYRRYQETVSAFVPWPPRTRCPARGQKDHR